MAMLLVMSGILAGNASGDDPLPHQGSLVLGDFSAMQLESVRVRPDGALELERIDDYTALEPFDVRFVGYCMTAPAVGMDRDGRYLVAWEGTVSGTEPDIFAQAFDAGGRPVSSLIPVAVGPGSLTAPAVAIGSDGTALVSWSETNASDGNGTRARLFMFGGDASGGLINISWDKGASHTAVAAGPDGGFLVAWKQFRTDGGVDVLALRLTAGGQFNGSEFLVSGLGGRQTPPAVGFFPDGGFLVAWETVNDQGGCFLTAQRYNATGERNGTGIDVSPANADQVAPVLAINSTGGFVLAWENRQVSSGRHDVHFRRFFADGSPDGQYSRVSGSEGESGQAALAIGPMDHILIAWVEFGGIYALRYASDGTLAGTVPGIWPGDASDPAVAINGTDELICLWQQSVQSGTTVRGRKLLHPFVPTGSVTSGDVRAPPDLVRWSNLTAVLGADDAGAEPVQFSYWTNQLGAWTPVPENGSIAGARNSNILRLVAVLSTDTTLSSPVLREIRIGYFSNHGPTVSLPADMTARRNTTVVIEANVSDADNDTLGLSWALVEGPPVDWTGNGTDTLSFKPSLPGTYRFLLTVTDGIAKPRSGIVNVTVPNMPPVAVLAVPVRNVLAGWSVAFYSSDSHDPDGGSALFNYHFGDGNESGWTAKMQVEHVFRTAGNYSAWLVARDSDGAEATSFPVNLSVAPSNTDPVITSSPAGNATVGQEWSYVLEATDPDRDALLFCLTAGPGGMQIGAGGNLSWVPDPGQEGVHSIVVTVLDGRGGQGTQHFMLTVEPAAPVLPSCAILLPAEGARIARAVTIRGTAAPGSSPVQKVMVRVDGGTWFVATGREDWQVRLSTYNYADGPHVIEAQVLDQAQQTGNTSVNVTIRNIPEPVPWVASSLPAYIFAAMAFAAAVAFLILRRGWKG